MWGHALLFVMGKEMMDFPPLDVILPSPLVSASFLVDASHPPTQTHPSLSGHNLVQVDASRLSTQTDLRLYRG
jgi:hypothetical protein